MLNHLEKHNTLTNLNHGFRSGYSCTTQLLVTTEDLINNYDKNIQIDMAILDFSKAFDTVPHNKLLNKLESYGINGNINKWLTEFLTNRNMRVVVEGEHSKYVHVESGVPQGTVLGPLLFLCHINDLPNSVKSQVRLFADDCLLYRQIKTANDHQILQEDLAKLESWADTWGMKFNAKKCYIMSIKQKSSFFYQLDKHILEKVNTNPYLGLTISDDLKWSSHINKIANKASCTLGFLRRNLRQCPQECKKLAYLAMVRSVLEYGSVIWDPYTNKDIDRLESIQKRAARFIKHDYRSREKGCVTRMLEDLKLEPLQERRKHQRLVMFYRVVEGLVPALQELDYLQPNRNKRRIRAKVFSDCESQNIVKKQEINNTRGYNVTPGNTDIKRYSFFERTTIDWNHLEEKTVRIKTVEGFASALQQCD